MGETNQESPKSKSPAPEARLTCGKTHGPRQPGFGRYRRGRHAACPSEVTIKGVVLLLGAALCVFYLLELSLAEHLGFVAAYAIAGAAVSVMIGWRIRRPRVRT